MTQAFNLSLFANKLNTSGQTDNTGLQNSTISGVALGTNLNPLTIGTGLSGSSYNGTSAVTIANTGVTSIVAGANISVSGATGAVTVSATNTLINNTGVSSDITLGLGQTAYVTFSGATSVPLHIATGSNEVYEMSFVNTGTITSDMLYLNPNNSSSWQIDNFVTYSIYSPSSGNAPYYYVQDNSGFALSIGGCALYVTAKIMTNTYWKNMLIQGRSSSPTNGYGYNICSNTNNNVIAWTSLGTLVSASSITGTVWIKRIG